MSYKIGFGCKNNKDFPKLSLQLSPDLTLCMLGKIFSRWHCEIFFLENRIWHFMQIGDNLYEVSDPIFVSKFYLI